LIIITKICKKIFDRLIELLLFPQTILENLKNISKLFLILLQKFAFIKSV